MRPCFLSRRSLSYAAPFPVRKPCGVGLCCTMKLYQSMTHTLPSGPTSAMMGDAHSSSLATRLKELLVRKWLPSRRSTNVPTRCPVGSATKAVRFQYSLGIIRGRVKRMAARGRVPAVIIHLPHFVGRRLEHVAVGDRVQHKRRRPAADRLVIAIRDRHVDARVAVRRRSEDNAFLA